MMPLTFDGSGARRSVPPEKECFFGSRTRSVSLPSPPVNTAGPGYAVSLCRAAYLMIAAPSSAIMIVGRGDRRHHRGVADSESLEPMHLKLVVDDRHSVASHHAGAAGV